MFKIKASPTFDADVKILTPEGPQTLKLTFKHKTRKGVSEYFAKVSDGSLADGEALAEIVDGWKDVDTPFSVEALETLTQEYHGAVPAIYEAYIQALTQAKQGN